MRNSYRFLAVSAAVVLVAALVAAEDPAVVSLKGRTTAPVEAFFDHTVTLASLLAKPGAKDWSAAKAATIEAYVIQVVKSDDGDYRLSVAAKPGETNSKLWVIVEATPAWLAKEPSLAEAKLADRGLIGKKVRATGWLFFDTAKVTFPRGTDWEIHPVTKIERWDEPLAAWVEVKR
jgi:hypothetical protein